MLKTVEDAFSYSNFSNTNKVSVTGDGKYALVPSSSGYLVLFDLQDGRVVK